MRRFLFASVFLWLILSVKAQPMGWNSFDSYGLYLNHTQAVEMVEQMALRYKHYGYEYFVIDAGWFGEYKTQNGTRISAERHASDVHINQYGLLQPSQCNFPQGLKVIADMCHAKGLKFGVHLMRGIPRKAVRLNTKVQGTTYRARDIADTASICHWNAQNYGVDMSRPGAQQFYNSLIDQLASWGVDFVKYDDIVEYPQEVQAVVRAIAQCGRPMILSLSPGDRVDENHLPILRSGNMLRVTGDVWDDERSLNSCFTAWRRWQGKNSVNFFIDMDMIPFGELQKMSPPIAGDAKSANMVLLSGKGTHRQSEFTPPQMRTFITMRALACSPLMIGGDLKTMDRYSFRLLTNPEMIACNQSGVMGRIVSDNRGVEVWRNEGWIGVFNRATETRNVTLDTQTLGGDLSKYELYDIWGSRRVDLGGVHKLDAGDVLFLRYAPRITFVGVQVEQISPTVFRGTKDSVLYTIEHNALGVNATIENLAHKPLVPQKRVSLTLGIDTYMEKFPDWNDVYFPTMMRAERTHFTSYFMTPSSRILLLASPDAVASWHYNYEQSLDRFEGKDIFWGAHRIKGVSLDLLNPLPLPSRHPQHLYCLAVGERRTFRLRIKESANLDSVLFDLHRMTGAASLEADLYTIGVGERFEGSVFADELRSLEIRTPRGEVDNITCDKAGTWSYAPYSGVGQYTLTALCANGKVSEMKLFVRPDFSFYLLGARSAGLVNQPTLSHHAECFYPLYSYFLARRYLPDTEMDSKAEDVFQRVFPVLYDETTGRMRTYPERIQDAATMAGVLADRYAVTRCVKDLERAASLVDFLLTCQGPDGGYYNKLHKVHYTSVIYIAKSVMEVMGEEKKLTDDPLWAARYDRHRLSVIRALDDLARRGDDLQTEGQMTFEDGMISCSVTQLALGALKTQDKELARRYLDQALTLDAKHQCLTQLLIPDSRMNGATLRFWESQYTVNLMHNAMNSPCGWSSWKTYGSWYLYLLTGDYRYMRRVLNALGSSLQLLDAKTGELHFGFMPDPYIDANQFMEVPQGSRQPELRRVVLGEQYISQISQWHKAEPEAWRKKWGIDNFVHEAFKCMSETMLTNAYIIEHADGRLQTINCTARNENGRTVVEFSNPLVENLHINLRGTLDIYVASRDRLYKNKSGLGWVGGEPYDLVKF